MGAINFSFVATEGTKTFAGHQQGSSDPIYQGVIVFDTVDSAGTPICTSAGAKIYSYDTTKGTLTYQDIVNPGQVGTWRKTFTWALNTTLNQYYMTNESDWVKQ